ncbi:MAG: 2,3-bisphosphoglycerate-independent phosphoglycerate mutase [Eubacterium sp.]|nr:2,3-bisphosphoglycerate-independent phosphoglycerate mutase [Eubacterium sp.]MDE6505922.1 2,3-bisphosphoglycerate-independent phosphoglycerate mutase [Eubacterium sp.]
MKKPVVLCIMDGFGKNDSDYGNAISMAETPNLDKLMAEFPMTYIGASGMDVGLPDGQMGNSEVGHTNMGAGRVVYQPLTRITKAFADGEAYENPALCKAMENAKDKSLHLIGLVSPGGVHSHTEHLYGLLEMAKKSGVQNVFVHALLDGRDVPPSSAVEYLAELEDKMKEIGVGKIASVMGRFYAMDRDNIWDRVEKAYAAIVYGEGVQAESAVDAVKASYETIDEDGKHLTDEFVLPTVIGNDGRVKENDSVIFFNFRPDRAREITRTFVDPEFKGFERRNGFFSLYYVCMTQYDAEMPNVDVAFGPEALTNTLGEYLSSQGKTQLRIAETQKYAHVTFFFNGGEEKQYEGEDRILVDSPKISTFDLMPEMSAPEVSAKLNEAVRSGKYDVVIVNFANCDMVGHTGIIPAAVKAVETVDTCVGSLVEAVRDMDGVLFVTADHGNADKMLDENGEPFTAHTTNPVPFIVVNYPCDVREGGRLCDIAPTMLKVMGLEQPKEMSGESIIK